MITYLEREVEFISGIVTKEDLEEAAMELVAHMGMLNFSMRKVTERLGVSEASIYRYFDTKESLLRCCYDKINAQLVDLLQVQLEAVIWQCAQKDPDEIFYSLWKCCFSYWVENTYRTIYYFEYRDSMQFGIPDGTEKVRETVSFRRFEECLQELEKRCPPSRSANIDYLWIYMIDVTGIFAKRVIRGELPDTEESYENIWRLISKGALGLVPNFF